MIYQDAWANGARVGKGYRECAQRYAIVKDFCTGLPEQFSVCDIGANMCYFGIRLTEDFPGCSVVAFEHDHFELRAAHLEASGARRVLLLNKRLRLSDLSIFATVCRFDLVLALSVLHHLGGDSTEWLKAFAALGKNLIVEFAGDDSERTKIRKNYSIPAGGQVLGQGASHLRQGANRPMVLFSGAQ